MPIRRWVHSLGFLCKLIVVNCSQFLCYSELRVADFMR